MNNDLVVLFAPPLRQGTICERKSIYVFTVDVKDGKRGVACFCPAQGKMGAIRQWAGVPCLLSPAKTASPQQERSTAFTVEAVGDPSRPGEWIGINQLKYKDYVEFFLRKNVLQDCVKVTPDDKVVRFASAKQSGADFAVNSDTAIQVRMPLMALYDDKALAQLQDGPKKRKSEEQTLDKWFGTTPSPQKKSKESNEPPSATPKTLPKTYKRVVVILCFASDAPILDPKAEHFPREIVANAGSESAELWQLNLSIDAKAVSFKRLVRL